MISFLNNTCVASYTVLVSLGCMQCEKYMFFQETEIHCSVSSVVYIPLLLTKLNYPYSISLACARRTGSRLGRIKYTQNLPRLLQVEKLYAYRPLA